MSGIFLTVLAAGAGLIVFALFFLILAYKKVPNNHSAMIINGLTKRKVTFNGGFVLPRIHTKEIMDISVKTIELNRKGENSLSCKDNIRADISINFYIGVNPTTEDVLAVSQAIGAKNTSDMRVLEEHFLPKFSEAVKTVGKDFDFIDLLSDRDGFNAKICALLDGNMDGFRLQRVAIDYLEQAPLSAHRDDNIIDVEGIKKITELTAIQNIETHRLIQEETETTKKREVETAERLNELTRQEKESEAKTNREIAVTAAQENATTEEEVQKMRLVEEEARIATDEKIEIKTHNKDREVEATKLNNERVLVEERELVKRSGLVEQVATDEQVTLRNIEKDKKAEVGLKEVADIESERVAVERKITVEKEETADISNKSAADRSKLTIVTAAEAQAEESAVKQVMSAKADKESAIHEAEQISTLADANLVQKSKEAEGIELLARATKAQVAAPGLAQAQVDAENAIVSKEQGLADAEVLEAKGNAEAKTTEAKAEALTKMNDAGMEFEKMDREFKLRETLGKEQIQADVQIAASQTSVVASALKEANIDIVGGSNEFFSHIQNMVTKGKGIDAMVKSSDTIGTLGKEYLNGNKSLPQDIKETISSLSTSDFANMSVAQFLQTSQGKSLAGMIPGGLEKLIPGIDAK
jgi:flotillin